MTAGNKLYERFCGSEVSDHARGYNALNPAVQADWERLGREWEALTDVLAQAAIVPLVGEGTGFLRRRVETTQALLTLGDIPTKWRQR